jgi:chromosome segregation ATPase
LLILEKERNLELQELIVGKDEMVEALTKELSLLKTTMEKKDIEISHTKFSIVDLESAKDTLKANLSCLKVHYQELEEQLDTLENTTFSLATNLYSSSSTSMTCKRCSELEMNTCLTNHDK